MIKPFDIFEGIELSEEDLKIVNEVKMFTNLISSLKKEIKKKNLNLKDLNKLTGLSIRKLNNIFNGEIDPSLNDIIKLCMALDLNLQIVEHQL